MHATPPLTRRSIHANARPTPPPSLGGRQARLRRRHARLEAVSHERPPLSTDRLTPIQQVLRLYRERAEAPELAAPLATHLAQVEAEVVALEAWAAALGRARHRAPAAIRGALELLRGFGRLLVLDFSSVPAEDRSLLVGWLALEHRLCYAAAGTTRAAFKGVVGRTGAR